MKKRKRILSTIMILSMIVTLLPVELSASDESVVIYEEGVESMEADISSEAVAEEIVERDVPEEAVVVEPITEEAVEDETELVEVVEEEAAEETDVLPLEEANEEVIEEEGFTTMAVPYNSGDVKIVQGIMANNPSAFSGIDKNNPASWGGIGLLSWKNTGTEYRIISLFINFKGLTGTLDVRGLTELEALHCAGNELTGLNINEYTQLDTVLCSNNKLTALNVDKLKNLKRLECDNNQLTALNINSNTLLNKLDCSDNQILDLSVDRLVNLETLDCGSNQLTTLDISKNLMLSILVCRTNLLTSLDISKNVLLEHLSCWSNRLTSLDVSKLVELTTLYCSNNFITSLDVSKRKKLTELHCNNNRIATLDVTNNTALESLNCSGNLFQSLDLTNNIALTTLDCGITQITNLDLSKNVNLTHAIRIRDLALQKFITPSQKTVTVALSKGARASSYFMLSDNSMGLVASNIEGRKFERWEHSSDATVVKNDGRYITFIVDKDVTLSPVYRYKVVAEPNEFTGGNTDVSMAVYGENPYYQKVTIDNVEVTVNVTANSDGTLTIDIPADYLKTLSNGEYILRIDYTDGYAETTIKVSGNVEEPVEKPTTPTNPTPPTEPTTPTNPAYPTEPTTPTNPTTPSNPITSAKPAATTTTQIRASSNSTNAASATSVRTGDSSQIYLWTALCIMALIVITGSVGNMSKKYRRNK